MPKSALDSEEPSIEDFLIRLSNEMIPLKNEQLKTLTGIIEVGDYYLFAIISGDKTEVDDIIKEMFRKNLISKPGKLEGNNLTFYAYQILKFERDPYKPILEELKDMGHQAFFCKSNLKKDSSLSLADRLSQITDYLMKAYER